MRIVLAMILAACGGEPPLEVRSGCQGLSDDCVLPYPSDFFLRDGEVVLSGAAKLLTKDGVSADLSDHRPIYGFSRVPLIVAVVGGSPSREALVTIDEPVELSMDPGSSPTLIVHGETGELIPHFVDIDALDGTREALVIHPLVSLLESQTYVVSIAGLAGAEAHDGFRRLRDGIDESPRFDRIFEVLERAGVDRTSMQLAWDFTTGADDEAVGDMFDARDAMAGALPNAPLTVTIDRVIEDPPDEGKALIHREIHGSITVPLALDDPDPGGTLRRGADGKVVISGSAELPFIAMVPKSLAAGPAPGRLLFYGHGFFGDRREVLHESPQKLGDELGAVLICIDWWGMSRGDVTSVAAKLAGEPFEAALFVDRVHQGIVNWMALAAAARGPLLARSEFMRADGSPLFDPSRIAFLGISQGHILGGVVAGVVPGLEAVALNAGGAGLTHMMYRAKPFEPFLEIMALSITDPLARLTYAATMQRQLDRIDPAIYARYAEGRVLLQIGVADTSVPDITGYLHGRLLGAGLIEPSPVEPFAIAPYTDQKSALAIYDFGADRSFMQNHSPPPTTNEVHEAIRTLAPAIRQLGAFLYEGTTIQACDGACDPE
jgi:hypothetical protein